MTIQEQTSIDDIDSKNALVFLVAFFIYVECYLKRKNKTSYKSFKVAEVNLVSADSLFYTTDGSTVDQVRLVSVSCVNKPTLDALLENRWRWLRIDEYTNLLIKQSINYQLMKSETIYFTIPSSFEPFRCTFGLSVTTFECSRRRRR